jgi:virginiamycin B lyase
MRRLVLSLVALVALGAAVSPAAASAGQGVARIVYLPKGTEAEALAVGPEGSLWFAGSHRGADPTNLVGRIVKGVLDEHEVPESGSMLGVGDLARGPEGKMWFTEPAANRIEWAAPDATPEGFTLPTPGSRPTGIVAVGGSLWATLEGSGRLTEINPALSSRTEFPLPPGWRPTALAVGKDRALWVVDGAAPEVARKPPTETTITYPPPASSKGARYSDIISGPDGNLWIGQSDGPSIDKLEAAASKPRYKRFELPLKGGISTLSKGPHNDIWFAVGGRVGSIDTEGRSWGTPVCAISSCAPVKALAEGPGGALYFAAGGTIGRFEPAFLAISVRSGLRLLGRDKATISLACGGGAARQRCRGKVELLPRKGAGGQFGSARYGIVTSFSRDVAVKLSPTARTALGKQAKLPVRLVVRLAGEVVAARNLVLHAPR